MNITSIFFFFFFSFQCSLYWKMLKKASLNSLSSAIWKLQINLTSLLIDSLLTSFPWLNVELLSHFYSEYFPK